MLANLKLKSRLFLSYLVYLVFLSIPGAIAPACFYLNSHKFIHETPEIRQNLLANQLSESKIKLQESILAYVSTKDQVFVESYNVSFQQLNKAIALALRSNIALGLRSNIAVFNQQETDLPLESASSGEKILRLTQQLNDVNQYILAAIKSGKTEQAIRAIGADESRQIWLELTAEIEKLRIAEIQAESLKIQAVNTSIRQLIFMGALATLICFLLAIALGLVMTDRLLARGNQLLDLMLKSSGAIAQEMNEHEQSTQNQALTFSVATPQLRELHKFCQLSIEKSTSIGRDFAEISTSLSEVRSHLDRVKSLRELSDRLVDYSKKLSLNISLKSGQEDPENSRMLLLLNTEIKNLTTYAQKLAYSLSQIVVESENVPSNISFTPPCWGGNSSEYSISKDLISHDGFASPSGLIDRLLILCEQSKIQTAQLALSSQEQAANSQQLLQSNEQLEEVGLTTACGIAETTIQVQKLHQLAGHLKCFLGDRAS